MTGTGTRRSEDWRQSAMSPSTPDRHRGRSREVSSSHLHNDPTKMSHLKVIMRIKTTKLELFANISEQRQRKHFVAIEFINDFVR